MAGGDEALLRADVPAMTPMEINDNTEPEKSSSPGLSRAIYFQLVITGLVPMIHVLKATEVGRGWPGQARP